MSSIESTFALILLLFVLNSSAFPSAYIERDADCDYEEEGRGGPNSGPIMVSPNSQNSIKGFKPLYFSPDLEDIIDQQQYNVYHEPVHGTIIMPRVKFALNTGEGDCIKETEDDDYDYFGSILPKLSPKHYENVKGRRPLPGQPQRKRPLYDEYREKSPEEMVKSQNRPPPGPARPEPPRPGQARSAQPGDGPVAPQRPNWAPQEQKRRNRKRKGPVSIWPNPYYGPTIEEMMPYAKMRRTPDTYIVMADDPVLAVDNVPKCEQDTAQGGFDNDDLGNFSPTPGAGGGGGDGDKGTTAGDSSTGAAAGAGSSTEVAQESTTAGGGETTAAADGGSTAGAK